jgi:hypothetical protein
MTPARRRDQETAMGFSAPFGRFGLSLVLGLLSCTPLSAGVVTSTLDDGGPGTLRTQVLAGGAVTFAPALAGQTITLTQGAIVIAAPGVSIQGPGADQLTITATGSRIFDIVGGIATNVTFRGLRLADANAGAESQGGALRNGGSTVLERVAVTGNSAGDAGGGVYNTGTLTVLASEFSGNTVTDPTCAGGGAIRSNGDDGFLVLLDSTVSGNSAPACNGGGLSVSRGALLLRASTVADNSAGSAGGNIYKGDGAVAPQLWGSVVADGSAGGGTPVNRDLHGAIGGITSQGFNLVQQRGDSTGYDSTDLGDGIDPQLGPLDDNGGGTRTHAVPGTSPLLDAVSQPCPTLTDQRLVSRPRGQGCEIGAFERRVNPLVVSVSGTGTGSVSAAAIPAPVSGGISGCSTACSADYDGEGTAPVVTLTATPDPGQAFTRWSGECVGDVPVTTVVVDQSRLCLATFGPGPVLVTVVVGANGSMTPGSNQTVPFGDPVIFTVTPDPGYRIDAVSGCGGVLAGDQFTTAPITAPCTVSASFAINTFTVGGTVSGLVATSGLVLQLNGGNDLPIAGNGPFVFGTPLDDLSAFAVTVGQQPSAPAQVCTVTGGTGSLGGANYTGAQVACSAPPALTISLANGRDYIRYGSLVDYVVTVDNTGATDASAISVAGVLPPTQVDSAFASWQCFGAGAGAVCSASGTGDLNDSGVAIPVGRSLTWLVSAPVLPDAPGDRLDYTVGASAPGLAAVSASDSDLLVLLRSGFQSPFGEAISGTGTLACAPGIAPVTLDLAAGHLLDLPAVAPGQRITTMLSAAGFRVERIDLAAQIRLRLVGVDAGGRERGSAWSALPEGATLALAAVAIDGASVLLLEGTAEPLSLRLDRLLPATVAAGLGRHDPQTCH